MGSLAITPDVYWESSLTEVSDMMQGEYERELHKWQRASWMTAHLMNISGKELKRSISPDELLGKGNGRRTVQAVEGEEQVAELVRRQRELQGT